MSNKFYGKEDNLFTYLVLMKKKYQILNNPSLKELFEIEVIRDEPIIFVLFFQNLKQLTNSVLYSKFNVSDNDNVIVFCLEKFLNSVLLSDEFILKKCEEFFNLTLDKADKEKVILMNKINKESFFNIFEKIKFLGKDFFVLNDNIYKTDPIYLIYNFYYKTKSIDKRFNNDYVRSIIGDCHKYFLLTGINAPLLLLPLFTKLETMII